MNLEFGQRAKKDVVSVETKMLSWPECLYREKDAAERLALLAEAERQNLQPEETKLRRYLLDHRYQKGSKDKVIPDNFMRVWLEVSFGYESIRKGKVPLRLEKSISREMKKCGLLDYEFGELGEQILYHELYHMAVLYINLCLEDKQYRSLILGIGHMSDDKLSKKIARDMVKTGYLVPEAVKFPHYEVWERAVMDAYEGFYPDNADYVEQLKNGESEV